MSRVLRFGYFPFGHEYPGSPETLSPCIQEGLPPIPGEILERRRWPIQMTLEQAVYLYSVPKVWRYTVNNFGIPATIGTTTFQTEFVALNRMFFEDASMPSDEHSLACSRYTDDSYDEGEPTSSASILMWQGGSNYFPGRLTPIVRDTLYFPYIILSVSYGVFTVSTFSVDSVPGVTGTLSFGGWSFPLSWFSTLNPSLPTGDITIEAIEYWPYARDDGSDPIYDSLTGEQLRSPHQE